MFQHILKSFKISTYSLLKSIFPGKIGKIYFPSLEQYDVLFFLASILRLFIPFRQCINLTD